ncbi:DUF5666 domain-containing protein [Amycolatopsis sp. CA-230715]|uniref:DUF5666 domain-containing protein n=1 Tax=Amycolatopsis sp. CA-230715 TaxID=2745196 RepID=UPI001C036EB4|nr:DUF5666 domain-containing protein [Amycolatopsis sp. CA-230715]QWF79884.1 hypothetical protein HUW46_03297 [Amycolatopsis sp. CA-230715]
MPEEEITKELLLTTPVSDEDLAAEMKRAGTPVGKSTLVLTAVLLVAVSFGAGAWTHAATSSQPSARPQQAAGQQAGRQAGRGGTVGTVERIEGSTVYVKTMQGNEVSVSTTDSTKVGLSKPGALADLAPGSTVAVQGTTGADGTVAAQSITQQPARGN